MAGSDRSTTLDQLTALTLRVGGTAYLKEIWGTKGKEYFIGLNIFLVPGKDSQNSGNRKEGVEIPISEMEYLSLRKEYEEKGSYLGVSGNLEVKIH